MPANLSLLECSQDNPEPDPLGIATRGTSRRSKTWASSKYTISFLPHKLPFTLYPIQVTVEEQFILKFEFAKFHFKGVNPTNNARYYTCWILVISNYLSSLKAI